MVVSVFKAKTTLQKQMVVEAQARQHVIKIDEPKELGGTDVGMNPVELVLASLGACQTIAAQVYAKKFEVAYDELYVEVEGDLDLDGFLDKGDVRPGFTEIRYTVHLTTNEPQEKVHRFLAFVETHCPVGDTLTKGVRLVANEPKLTAY